MRIGVAGAGHLGKIHLRCIQQISEYELVGFYDTNPDTREMVTTEFGVQAFDDYTSLVASCDILDIVTPTGTHYALASEALIAGKHVFIEKPVCATMLEARELLQLAKSKGLKVQVGHVERFNPAFQAIEPYGFEPMFIEGHRLAQFNPRGTDVSVVLDLMIHDLDLILHLIHAPVKEIHANGVAVISREPDICNARIVFENGATVNLTASRISLKNMRKLRLFQPHCYVSIDFLEKEVQIVQLADEISPDQVSEYIPLDTGNGRKYIKLESPVVQPNNAIVDELRKFLQSIQEDRPVLVDLEDGTRALDIAFRIMEKIKASHAVL